MLKITEKSHLTERVVYGWKELLQGKDLYVFNFCAAFASLLYKEEISWSFLQFLNFIKISISFKQHFAELEIATPNFI